MHPRDPSSLRFLVQWFDSSVFCTWPIYLNNIFALARVRSVSLFGLFISFRPLPASSPCMPLCFQLCASLSAASAVLSKGTWCFLCFPHVYDNTHAQTHTHKNTKGYFFLCLSQTSHTATSLIKDSFKANQFPSLHLSKFIQIFLHIQTFTFIC